MSEKMKPTPDLKELPAFGMPQWLAGYMEIGGSMYFETMNNRHKDGRVYPYARPEIQLGDKDRERVQILNSLIGGRLDLSNEVTTYALAKGDRAVWLAYWIKPYTPSRLTIIGAFQQWLSAETTEERVAIAQAHKGRRVLDSVSADHYMSLVNNPDFVGGIIDGRGRINHNEILDRRELSSWTYNIIRFSSVNGSLLLALQHKFGGHIEEINRAGDSVKIHGTATTLRNDIFTLTIGSETMQELVRWARPLLPLSNI